MAVLNDFIKEVVINFIVGEKNFTAADSER